MTNLDPALEKLMPTDEQVALWWREAAALSFGKYSMAKYIARRTVETLMSGKRIVEDVPVRCHICAGAGLVEPDGGGCYQCNGCGFLYAAASDVSETAQAGSDAGKGAE